METAFKLGNKVAIGLSTDALLENKSYRDLIQSYEEREAGLRNFIENELQIGLEDYTIIPLDDPFGPAIKVAELQAHVSSAETFPGAMMINDLRIQNGLNPLVLIIIPLVLNESGEKVSSTEIRANL